MVLPFQAIAAEGQDQAYCARLTETVTTKVAALPSLEVLPTSEVRQRKVESIERARTELGANLVLEASWQHAGDNVRINLSLIHTRTARQLRTDMITAQAKDLFALQDRVVARAVDMLNIRLQPHQAEELTAHGILPLAMIPTSGISDSTSQEKYLKFYLRFDPSLPFTAVDASTLTLAGASSVLTRGSTTV